MHTLIYDSKYVLIKLFHISILLIFKIKKVIFIILIIN